MKAALCWFVLVLAASCWLASESTSCRRCNYLKASVVIVVDVSVRTYTTRTCTREGWWLWNHAVCSHTTHRDPASFNKAATFINNLLGNLEEYVNPLEARIGVVKFSSGTSNVLLQFADNHCINDVNAAVLFLGSAPNSTSTSRGLQEARAMLASTHARSNVSHLVVLVTDMKNFDEASTGLQVDQMNTAGIQLLSVLVDANPVNVNIYNYSSSVYTWTGSQALSVANKIKQLGCQR